MRTSITLILERKMPFQNIIYFQEDMTMLLNKKDAVCSRFFRGCSVFSAFTARADRRAVKQIFQQT